MSEIDDVRHEFVQLWGSMAHFWGISPTTARVFSWLYTRSESADTDEIMDGLELSRGAVSMACRELRDWGLVMPDKEPGSRRVTYRPSDLEKVIRSIIRTRKSREWDPILERLREWIPRLEADTSTEAQLVRERLQSFESLIALADSMLEVLLKGGMVGRVGLKLLLGASPDRASQDHASHHHAPVSESVEEVS